MLIQALASAFLLVALAACLYYWFLAVVGLRIPHPVPETGRSAGHRFAILIPAHNEEAGLAQALNSCSQLDYPPEKYCVYVIADNCTDRTAAIARAQGAICLERHDPERPGKGQALAWALELVLPEGPDAVVILDADCCLDVQALRAFDRRLAAGEQVLQAKYVASNPDASLVSYVAGVGNLVENDLFYAPKSQLGLAVLLRGTGMVFHREVLECCPWQANSIVEDAEHTLQLTAAGIRVHFVPEARVLSDFPVQRRQLLVQRSRWIGGTFRLCCQRALPWMVQGALRNDWVRFDLGWTLLAAARSMVLLQLLLTVLLGGLSVWLAPGRVSWIILGLGCGLVGLQGLYFALGALLLGLKKSRLRLLVGSPGIIAELLWIACRSVLSGWRKAGWERTPR